jgi:hypothetical protein
MASVYEDVIPTLIENTTMQMRVKDGVPFTYRITPIAGYVLHDNARDWNVTNPATGETTHYLGYSHGTASCPVSYDFTANPREFFAVPEDSVPADQIFGAGGNSHVTS